MNQNKEPDSESKLLAWAATRASSQPHLFANILERYQELNQLDEDELCERLHCSPDILNHLRLCGQPDREPYAFTVDIKRVAGKLGLKAGVLASIVREVDASDTFRRITDAGGMRSTITFSSTPGLLQAARDLHDEPEREGSLVEESDTHDHPKSTGC